MKIVSMSLKFFCSFYSVYASWWICLYNVFTYINIQEKKLLVHSHVQLFCKAMDCGPPGSSVHGISQARILKWVPVSSSREPSWPRDWTHVSCIGRWVLYHWATRASHINMHADVNTPFSSVAQSCPTLCDPMDCSTPGLPVHHQLPEFTQTHVHWISDATQPPHPLSSPLTLVPPKWESPTLRKSSLPRTGKESLSFPSRALLARTGFSFEGTWQRGCHPGSVVPDDATEAKTHWCSGWSLLGLHAALHDCRHVPECSLE